MIDQYDSPDFDKDRADAGNWARELLKRDDVVVLDTETTGLEDFAEIVQIAISDLKGNVLLDTFVKPSHPIPVGASRIHGITDETVADAPTWDDVRCQVRDIVAGKLVVIYNAKYDTRLLRQSDRLSGHVGPAFAPEPPLGMKAYTCCMEQYAKYVGDWNDYRGNYRWQELPSGDHSALGDCRATLSLIYAMAGDAQ